MDYLKELRGPYIFQYLLQFFSKKLLCNHIVYFSFYFDFLLSKLKYQLAFNHSFVLIA